MIMGAIQDFVEGVRHYALYVPQCLANILKKKKSYSKLWWTCMRKYDLGVEN